MNIRLLALEQHPSDNACFHVTLVLTPNKLQRFLGQKPRIEKFVGHKTHWYYKDDMRPAPRAVIKFLEQLFFSGDYRHLLAKIKKTNRAK